MITKQDLQFNEYKDSKLPAIIMLKKSIIYKEINYGFTNKY